MPFALPLQTHLRDVTPLVYGCMALGGDWNGGPVTEADIAHAHEAVEAALDIGITLFDHADIYRRGKAETVFGELLKRDPGLRARIRLAELKRGLLVRQRHIGADIAARAQAGGKGREILRRNRLLAVIGGEPVLTDPVVVDERRARMAGRPADHAGGGMRAGRGISHGGEDHAGWQ